MPTDEKNILPVNSVAPGGAADLAKDDEGFSSNQSYLTGDNYTNMTDNNFNEIAGGFYADCVACYRMPCDVESVYNEACLASEAVTRKTDFFPLDVRVSGAFSSGNRDDGKGEELSRRVLGTVALVRH